MVFSPSTSKSIAFPAEGVRPQPDALDNAVRVAATFDLSVCIMCFTQERFEHWLALAAGTTQPSLSRVHILDANRAPLADWLDYLAEDVRHLTILSGAYSELQAGRLAAPYLYLLVEAVSDGLVVLT